MTPTKQQTNVLGQKSTENQGPEANPDQCVTFVSSPECCPFCGSSEYSGGSMGGRCFECGYAFGFHGASEFQLNERTC